VLQKTGGEEVVGVHLLGMMARADWHCGASAGEGRVKGYFY
jgi:hypothetical protein